MDKAGAFFVGDEIGGAEVADVVPFPVCAFGTGEGVVQFDEVKLRIFNVA